MDPAVVSTDAGNRRQQITSPLEVGIVIKVLSNLALNLRDLFVERGEDFPN